MMAKKRSKMSTASSTYGNYAEFITQRFEDENILPGDRITITQGKKTVEGNLLAQNELGDQVSILVKLDNGYNIGIRVQDDFSLEKLEGSVELESFQVRVPDQESDLPKISLLATGGTIASRIDYQTGGVVMAMEPEEIFASLPELFDEVSFDKVHSLFNLGSEDMYVKQWREMAVECADALNGDSRGVVITHGTDTMGYSAAILSFMLPDLGAPVVLTGAQRSSDRGSYDGAMNLIAASRIAAKSDIASVMISMHGSSEDEYCNLSRGTKVRKMHTSRRDAFRTINELPLAQISRDGKITELHEDLPRRHNRSVEPKTDFEERVGLIKIHPGISPDILDYYVDKGMQGIILEGTGLGHFPTFPPAEEDRSWSPAIERAIDEGITMGMTSQCLYGRVHPFVYRALRTSYQLGVIYLQDMLPETAFVKLGWTLGNYDDKQEIREVMQTNLAGEISPISQYKEFLI
jgi:glutamyl-tRNA(Gln) amidotransferase subunit D